MIPSNMLLKPLNQVIEGYNNKIIMSAGGAELRKSAPKPVVHTSKPLVHTSIPEVRTSKPVVHTSEPVVHASRVHTPEVHTPVVHTSEVHPIASRPRAITRRIHTLNDHRNEVQALILVMSSLLLFAIWW